MLDGGWVSYFISYLHHPVLLGLLGCVIYSFLFFVQRLLRFTSVHSICLKYRGLLLAKYHRKYDIKPLLSCFICTHALRLCWWYQSVDTNASNWKYSYRNIFHILCVCEKLHHLSPSFQMFRTIFTRTLIKIWTRCLTLFKFGYGGKST